MRRLNVGFVPTGAVGKRLNAIKSDLNNRALPAHVNLAHRASTTQLDEELVDLIGDVVQDFDPFEVKIGGIETFLPASRVVVALVEPARLLESLHRKLVDALGWTEPFPYVPHQTLYGEGIDPHPEDVEDVAEQLRKRDPGEVAVVDVLTVTDKRAGDVWNQILHIPLGCGN